MVIEKIGSATFANGLVRIQTLCAGPDGNIRESGVLEVPGNLCAEVINSLVNTLKELENQLEEQGRDSAPTKKEAESKGNGKGKSKNKK